MIIVNFTILMSSDVDKGLCEYSKLTLDWEDVMRIKVFGPIYNTINSKDKPPLAVCQFFNVIGVHVKLCMYI